MIKWHVEKRKVKDLKLWKGNPRTITKKAYERLKKRITERGFHDVIKINIDNTILSGNQRKRALIELGIEEVECKVPDRALTEKEIKRINWESNISDGEWNFDMLANEDLDELVEIGFKDLERFKKAEEIKPEVEFSEELLEEHNYIVVYFDNTLDWNVIKDKLELKNVKTNYRSGNMGLGRVVSGKKLLNKLK